MSKHMSNKQEFQKPSFGNVLDSGKFCKKEKLLDWADYYPVWKFCERKLKQTKNTTEITLFIFLGWYFSKPTEGIIENCENFSVSQNKKLAGVPFLCFLMSVLPVKVPGVEQLSDTKKLVNYKLGYHKKLS